MLPSFYMLYLATGASERGVVPGFRQSFIKRVLRLGCCCSGIVKSWLNYYDLNLQTLHGCCYAKQSQIGLLVGSESIVKKPVKKNRLVWESQ